MSLCIVRGTRDFSSQVEGGKASSGEVLPGGSGGGEEDRLKDQGEEPPEVLKAVPTFILGGTLQGAVFRANLATNQTVADSGNLVCTMEWYKVSQPESRESFESLSLLNPLSLLSPVSPSWNLVRP